PTRECLRHRGDVAVEVNAPLRCASGAGGERDQRWIVGRRLNGGEITWRTRDALLKIIRGNNVLEARRVGERLLKLACAMRIHDSVRNLRLVEDYDEFVRP